MKQQRGVALITAILIMALITTLTFSLEWDNSLDLRRTYVSMYREEAIQAAIGAESWVLGILRQDLEDSETDHFGEIWASDIPPLPWKVMTYAVKYSARSRICRAASTSII